MAARHAIGVIVGDRDVLRVVDLEGDRLGAGRRFLFGLRRVELPVLDAIQLDLAEEMVLGRQLVDVPRRRRVGDVERRTARRCSDSRCCGTCRRPRASPRCSDTARPIARARERPRPADRRRIASCCTAGGKNVPANPWIWMSSRSDSLPAIHSTAVARGLMPPVKMPEAADDVGAALRRLEQRLRRPDALRSRCVRSGRSSCVVSGWSAMSTVSGFSLIVSRTM